MMPAELQNLTDGKDDSSRPRRGDARLWRDAISPLPYGRFELAISRMHSKKLIRVLFRWFAENARDLPWRRTRDPYAIWVSEIMLQQTQVKTVIPYWERWMSALPNIRSLARVRSGKLHKLWEGLGYYTRVRNMQKAARVLVWKHGGEFPEYFDQLLELPGIGQYTAGAICSIAFGQPKAAVDGNAIRVLTRIFGIDGDPRDKEVNATLWRLAERLVREAASTPSRNLQPVPGVQCPVPSAGNPASWFNQAVMELGALLCSPRQPRCAVCPVEKLCVAAQQHRAEQLPAVRPRPRSTQRHFVAIIARKGECLLARQRPAGVLNAELWEFPNVEVCSKRANMKQLLGSDLGITLPQLEPFCTIRHSITRYRITLEVFQTKSDHLAEAIKGCQWLTMKALLRLPFASAHRKVLQQLTPNRFV
jgi:A/G-specific adenine glycosylase